MTELPADAAAAAISDPDAGPGAHPHQARHVFHLMERQVMEHGPHLAPLPPLHERRARAEALKAEGDALAAREAAEKATAEAAAGDDA